MRPNSAFIGKFRSLAWIFVSRDEPIPLSIAYAICTGIGTIGAVILGVFIRREKISARKAPVISHNFKHRDAEINLKFWRI